MCGINGFNFKNEKLINLMNNTISHRGPDDSGIYINNFISLGHRRLSIIDLSKNGHQPIFNEDKSLILIFNGEIYNYLTLKKDLDLKGHQFLSNTDSEVILHLYEEYKEKCLDYLNGIFAFALYDIKNQSIFLARDRVGIKPLYYYWDNNKFIFSSEIKSIIKHPINKKINKTSLFKYFKFNYIPSPDTIWENIFKLEPSQYIILKNNKLSKKIYWNPLKYIDNKINNKQEIIYNIRSLTENAVRQQMISDRPLGVFLSGGIDSTIITGLASQYSQNPINTFTTGFDINNDKFMRDFSLAKTTSKKFDTYHNEIIIKGTDIKNILEKVIYHMDEPINNPTQCVTYLLARNSTKKVKVILGGDGGDEIFGGYKRYQDAYKLNNFQKLPNYLKKYFSYFLSKYFNKKNLYNKLNKKNWFEKYSLFLTNKDKNLINIINSDLFYESYNENFIKKYNNIINEFNFTEMFPYIDLQNWLPEESLMRSDKMTMAQGLEQRIPLLDHKLIEFSYRIPIKYKYNIFNSKILLKESFKDLIPSNIINKPKLGWFSPASHWLKTDLKDMAYYILSKDYCSKSSEFINFTNLKKVLDDHINQKKYNLTIIWSILSFQLWLKKYFK